MINIYGSNVINPDYLDSISYGYNGYSSNFITRSSYATSFEEYVEKINLKYNFSNDTSVPLNAFTVSVANEVNLSYQNSYSGISSQYYFTQNFYKESYALYLPNYLSDLSTYKNNLDSTFISYLDMLSKGYITYANFFDVFGTHLIGCGIYGGTFDSTYTIRTDQRLITSEIAADISREISVSLANYGSSSVANRLEASVFKSTNSSRVNIGYRSVCYGGNFALSPQIDQYYGNEINQWMQSVINNPALIGYRNDSLIPLWELLPNNYTWLYNSMKLAFDDYNKNITAGIASQFASTKPYVFTDKFTIRSSELAVDEKNDFSAQLDVIHSIDILEFDPLIFKKEGYKYVQLYLTFDAKEVDDGYQQIYILPNKDTNKNNAISFLEFEHKPGSRDKNYQTYSFSFRLYFTDIKESNFYIGYNARGSGSDTWIINNIQVAFYFSLN